MAIAASFLAPSLASAAEPVFHELPLGTHAFSLTDGPGEGIWFTGVQVSNLSERTAIVGSIGEAGKVDVFKLPDRVSAGQVVTGPDGNIWFAANYRNARGYIVPRIGRFSPGDGAFAEFAPVNRIGLVNSVATGPDGAVWFTLVYWASPRKRRAAIGRIDTSGAITQFPLSPRSGPGAIVAGRDGNLWFTERGGGVPKIGRITPAGQVSHFLLPSRRWRPTAIVAAPDGNLWFGEEPTIYSRKSKSRVGRITTAGKITQLRVPGQTGTQALAATPDGNLWFTTRLPEGPIGLGSITTGGTATAAACLKPTPCEIDADALGVDGEGQLWFSTSKYYSHNGGGGTGLMEGMMEEAEAGVVGFFPRD